MMEKYLDAALELSFRLKKIALENAGRFECGKRKVGFGGDITYGSTFRWKSA